MWSRTRPKARMPKYSRSMLGSGSLARRWARVWRNTERNNLEQIPFGIQEFRRLPSGSLFFCLPDLAAHEVHCFLPYKSRQTLSPTIDTGCATHPGSEPSIGVSDQEIRRVEVGWSHALVLALAVQ